MQDIDRLANRHIAKLLTKLDEINVPAIVKDEIKRHFFYLVKDVKDQILAKTNVNQ
jgi:hypothetical protein